MAGVAEPRALSAAPCPLCAAVGAALRHRDALRHYLRCPACGLLFVPEWERPPPGLEKARYDQHQNDPADARYRAFLAPLAEALARAAPRGARGLDFGCGPGPALPGLLKEHGLSVRPYDPFFAPDESVWSATFDFVAAAEVFEHLHHPRAEIDRLFRVLRPGGVLGVMTAFAPASAEELKRWGYLRDVTHVCFYDRGVFEYIADRWGARLEFPGSRLALLRRD